MAQPDDQFLIAQYEQCYESLRAHNDAIWQIPTAAGAIGGGLVLGAYTYVKIIAVLEATLAIAWILMFILLIALIKHRYFSNIEEETLSRIEDALQGRRIQRQTRAQEGIEFWHHNEPHGLQGLLAYTYLLSGMIVFLIVISVLIIVSPFFF